jgi:uncharacterized membrane protein
MAGQPPQEPPWQPQGQDDGRHGWQGYSPPSAAEGQETYAFPQSAAAPAPEYGQGYAEDRTAFAPPAPQTRQEPSFTMQDQGAPQWQGQGPAPQWQDLGAQQWQDLGAPQWQGQGAAPQWQDQAASQWKAPRQRSAKAKKAGASKGFVASLFDFSFGSFVTPKIIKALYVLVMIWTVLWALVFLRVGFKYGGAAGGFFTLIVVVPVFGLLTLGAFRLLLEFFMVMHRIHDELKAIRERGDTRV